MNPLQKSRLIGWFIFGTLSGLMFGCFVSFVAYGFWNSIVPPPRQNGRINKGAFLCREAQSRLSGREGSYASDDQSEAVGEFWNHQLVGSHYAVIPIAGHHLDDWDEFYAITNHPGYPTIRYRSSPNESSRDVAILGPHGFEEKR